MLKIDLIVVGRLRGNPMADLCTEYQSRLQWPLSIHELESKYKKPDQAQKDEESKILAQLKPGAHVIALDERGKSLRSIDFAQKIGHLRDEGCAQIQFIIGGADGLTPAVRQKANSLLSFGVQTWPHMLARVMLLEQIYRAQQILSGHPYHRE